jgi:hypothetical protein
MCDVGFVSGCHGNPHGLSITDRVCWLCPVGTGKCAFLPCVLCCFVQSPLCEDMWMRCWRVYVGL